MPVALICPCSLVKGRSVSSAGSSSGVGALFCIWLCKLDPDPGRYKKEKEDVWVGWGGLGWERGVWWCGVGGLKVEWETGADKNERTRCDCNVELRNGGLRVSVGMYVLWCVCVCLIAL